jgi:hypothetical protein
MKKILIPIVILAALFVVFNGRFNKGSQEFHSKIMPVSFEYPDGYHVEEKDDTIVIMLEEDYQSILRGERAGGEGPPAITIRVIDNPNNPGPRTWAEQYPPQSNYNLKTSEVTETTVSGYPGISYAADGLYASRNVIFGTDSRLYYINGQFLDRETPLYRDFVSIVDSIELK